ncbi:hypothetical protein LX81_02331 [Palleronia aestuarii]|uniref:ATP-dependent protease ClpP protease subunit n=1 Tax=Palleronia aestuarii TaxID=568105 RepID=A0A2W7ND36_9RHOB|nr:hypothetical protein [Palleronia aestuarii]PZX16057.1 hypothetical protein LX81_02331 [Palleronia aestuarii]
MRNGPRGAIIAILVLQIGIGTLLVLGDISAGWQGFASRPRAPALEEPVRPGDQTRRYRPGDPPPASPGQPFPPTGDLPPRLVVTEVERDGVPALRLTGTIAPGDGERIAEELAPRLAVEERPSILLQSPGGSVTDAIALGRFFREENVTTIVAMGDVCLSACPYLLAGGVTRHADEGATIGVHQHYFGENSVLPAFMAVEDIQRGQGLVMAYLEEMEIDLRLMQPALMTPPDEIYVLVAEELAEYGLVNEGET